MEHAAFLETSMEVKDVYMDRSSISSREWRLVLLLYFMSQVMCMTRPTDFSNVKARMAPVLMRWLAESQRPNHQHQPILFYSGSCVGASP